MTFDDVLATILREYPDAVLHDTVRSGPLYNRAQQIHDFKSIGRGQYRGHGQKGGALFVFINLKEKSKSYKIVRCSPDTPMPQ